MARSRRGAMGTVIATSADGRMLDSRLVGLVMVVHPRSGMAHESRGLAPPLAHSNQSSRMLVRRIAPHRSRLDATISPFTTFVETRPLEPTNKPSWATPHMAHRLCTVLVPFIPRRPEPLIRRTIALVSPRRHCVSPWHPWRGGRWRLLWSGPGRRRGACLAFGGCAPPKLCLQGALHRRPGFPALCVGLSAPMAH